MANRPPPRKPPDDAVGKTVDGLSKAFNQIRDAAAENMGRQMGARAQDKSSSLFSAVKRNKPDDLIALLAEGLDPNTSNRSGDTLLHVAAREGHEDIIEVLLKAGANPKPNKPDQLRDIPLDDAIRFGNVKSAKLLIEYGGWSENKDSQGMTLLHQACTRGKKEIAIALVKAGMDAVSLTDDGLTPLILSVSRRQKDIALYLLDQPDVVLTLNQPIVFGSDPACRILQLAAARHEEEVVEKLLALGASANEKDSRGRSPLCLAAEDTNADLARILILGGADVSAPVGKSGYTALHVLTMVSVVNLDMCRALAHVLMDLGADIEAKDFAKGATPLMAAIEHGRGVGVVELILDLGANMESRDKEGKTPLMLAVEDQNVSVTQCLIERGADVNARARADGATALIEASKSGDIAIIESLLNAKADVRMQDVHGYSALYHARLNKNTAAVALLEKALDENLNPQFRSTGGQGFTP